nr:MAG TPA: hypothetical protein [Caudoviricetes sp.]
MCKHYAIITRTGLYIPPRLYRNSGLKRKVYKTLSQK